MQLIDALERVAELARDLSCAEHRVLHYLLLRAYREDSHTAKVSSRELAHATGLARSNVKSALHSLVERNVIATDNGSASHAASYRLAFLEVVVLFQPLVRGPKLGPPPPLEKGLSSVQVGLFQTQGGPNLGPGVGAQQAHPPEISTAALKEDARARVDIDGTNVPIIDRLLKAKPKNFDNVLIQHFRGWLHGYMAKLGREPHPHAPDDVIVSQFLSCGEPHQLGRLLDDLLAERKEPGHSYAWFVTVALQRIHGISPEKVKQRRTELRLVKQRPPEEPTSIEGIQQQLLDTAQEKRMHFHR
jgi:hypothetical protein